MSGSQQGRDPLPEPFVPRVVLASRVPIHCEVGPRQRQRQLVDRDRQALSDMGGKARRHRADQVGPGNHTSDGEEARLPSATLRTKPMAASAVSIAAARSAIMSDPARR